MMIFLSNCESYLILAVTYHKNDNVKAYKAKPNNVSLTLSVIVNGRRVF